MQSEDCRQAARAARSSRQEEGIVLRDVEFGEVDE